MKLTAGWFRFPIVDCVLQLDLEGMIEEVYPQGKQGGTTSRAVSQVKTSTLLFLFSSIYLYNAKTNTYYVNILYNILLHIILGDPIKLVTKIGECRSIDI